MKYVIEKLDQVVFPRIYTDLEEAQSKADMMAESFDAEYVVHKLTPVENGNM